MPDIVRCDGTARDGIAGIDPNSHTKCQAESGTENWFGHIDTFAVFVLWLTVRIISVFA